MIDLSSEELAENVRVCNSQKYNITQAIQPHYVFLALNPTGYKIVLASDNAEQVFKNSPEKIIGKIFIELLEPSNAKEIKKFLAQKKLRSVFFTDRLSLELNIIAYGRSTNALVYRADDYICLEIETDFFLKANERFNLYAQRYIEAANEFSSYDGESNEISSFVCRMIRKLIQFDRVWFCEFDENNDGYVSGEDCNNRLPSLLYHRFPASDIPHHMREVYVKNKFRSILDIDAQPSMIIEANGNPTYPIDLSNSLARYPGLSHLQYLRNMGVCTSVSFSVIKEGRLVALFGAHSQSVTLISRSYLLVCQSIVDQYLTKHELISQVEQNKILINKMGQIQSIISKQEKVGYQIIHLMRNYDQEFNQLVSSNGCLYFNEGKFLVNNDFDEGELELLKQFIQTQIKNKIIFHSRSISSIAKDTLQLRKKISGILVINLSEGSGELLNTGPEFIIWYRKEHPYIEKWAGNPTQAVIKDALGNVGPRESFKAWELTVEGKSTDWKTHEILIAKNFRSNYLLRRALYQSQVQYQAAQKSNLYKSKFLANVSHELRSPMHSIMGFVEELIEKIDIISTEKQLKYLHTVKNCSQRLLLLINELLDLTKLESGSMKFYFATHDFRLVINDAIQEINPLLKNKNITVTLESNAEDKLTCDKQRLTQVMINLLSNAIRCSSEGDNIKVNLTSLPYHFRICVSDQGIGVPENECDLIFDKFVQSSKTKNHTGGTGLGLSICKEIVSAHQGIIWVENNASGGASFFIDLPRKISYKNSSISGAPQ